MRQENIGRHILLDVRNLVAQKVPSTTVFSWNKNFHWFAKHKIQQFRRPFVFKHNGKIMLWKNDEFVEFKNMSSEFEGFNYDEWNSAKQAIC